MSESPVESWLLLGQSLVVPLELALQMRQQVLRPVGPSSLVPVAVPLVLPWPMVQQMNSLAPVFPEKQI